jgi:hypothetical protein
MAIPGLTGLVGKIIKSAVGGFMWPRRLVRLAPRRGLPRRVVTCPSAPRGSRTAARATAPLR